MNENFKDFDCLIFPEEINLLKETKEKVENQILENKKGNQLAKAFNFLFGGEGNDDKKELTEEEKQSLNGIYSDEDIQLGYRLYPDAGKKARWNIIS